MTSAARAGVVAVLARLTPEQVRGLDRLAAYRSLTGERRVTRTDVIRESIDLFLAENIDHLDIPSVNIAERIGQ